MTAELAQLRVTLAALCSQKRDWSANLAAHEGVLRQARAAGCHLAVFPEMSLTGSLDPRRDGHALLNVASGPVQSLLALTREYSIGAVFGIAELADGGEAHITQIYANEGRLIGAYRKRHLGEGEEAFPPGTEAAVFRYESL